MLTSLAPINGETILPLVSARDYLNLTTFDSFHDQAVLAARDAAIAWAEGYSGRSLQQRQFLWATGWFRRKIRLPRTPLATVDSISYRGPDGVVATVTAGSWSVSGDGSVSPFQQSWPDGEDVRITFTAGYAAGAIPADLLQAVRMTMGHLFVNREAVNIGNSTSLVPMGAMALAGPYREVIS